MVLNRTEPKVFGLDCFGSSNALVRSWVIFFRTDLHRFDSGLSTKPNQTDPCAPLALPQFVVEREGPPPSQHKTTKLFNASRTHLIQAEL